MSYATRCGWLLLFAALGCAERPSPAVVQTPPKKERPAPIDAAPTRVAAADELPNALQLTPDVISGGQPEGEAGFERLQKLGVKTVISVDGAKPDVETAKKYGLRYVHLPHSYNGISDERVKELAKAVRDLDGPIYIHCHHGKHRSPAAAAAACKTAGLITGHAAEETLKVAGTNPNYVGLFQTVEKAAALSDAELDSVPGDFPETVPPVGVAKAMGDVEHAFDHLKLIAAAGWKTPADHPALAPGHEALILRECYTEMLRTPEVAKQSDRFRELLSESEAHAQALEDLLAGDVDDAVRAKAETVMKAVTKDCATCHQEFRDVPLKK